MCDGCSSVSVCVCDGCSSVSVCVMAVAVSVCVCDGCSSVSVCVMAVAVSVCVCDGCGSCKYTNTSCILLVLLFCLSKLNKYEFYYSSVICCVQCRQK